MFTGIIETTAHILEKTKASITVERPKMFSGIRNGQSIAVNGVCLSVVRFSDDSMRFDVVPETFSRTNLEKATMVNLERALPVNGRFEGHIVSGHVDTTVKILECKIEGNGERFRFELPESIVPFVVEKGSIALNGVSLTVATIDPKSFSVAVIPHTLKTTNLGELRENDGVNVNVEVDVMAKYISRK